MLEIILLIILTRKIGKIAKEKGLTAWKWKTANIVSWFGFELSFMLISYGYTQNLSIAMISGILGGLLGYFIVKNKIDKEPYKTDGNGEV